MARSVHFLGAKVFSILVIKVANILYPGFRAKYINGAKPIWQISIVRSEVL